MNKEIPLYGDLLIDILIEDFFLESSAGRLYIDTCKQHGWPFIIDHITVRCLDINRRAEVFLKKGYLYQGEMIEYKDQGWWAKIYRKAGFPPLFVDQAYEDAKEAIIPAWVKKFGEDILHHVAVLVADIDKTVDALLKNGVVFSGEVVGARGSRLRQIFTAAELRDGSAFTVLELTERNDYDGFYPEQANRLMESSTGASKAPSTPS
ncbi:MAG: hypothetical protein HY201_03550 [Nitrospirae bacterium]|nr:hypothetical protein [Candidatus Troglogloeales bacterium]MBI3598512.1 hypothetical protein [Candidatus Troglogloeales bacterium]